MQITRAKVTPVELELRRPVRLACTGPIETVSAFFVRLETRQGQVAWGCAVAHPELTGESPAEALAACREAADLAPGLHPLNIEYSMAELTSRLSRYSPAALCAFDLAFHDLLSLEARLPLYRLLGGFRDRIQTSVTIDLAPVQESVEQAEEYAAHGFRMLKIKGGLDPDEDVRRVRAIHRLLPDHTLRLDADGGYTVQEALDVARALQPALEFLEQPTPPDDLAALREVSEHSPVPVLADQSLSGPASALELAAGRMVNGLSLKLSTCGGLLCARQIEAVARAARLRLMVSCVIEPAMLVAAGLSLALSSPTVRYGDLDGFLDLSSDPSKPGFQLADGWLIATETPGLGYTVELN